uniref:Uncharacterized protein n=1 Tax=Arundo donax TaxID=35708 RepID=A0A0A9AV93_ARUDO
MYHRQSDLSSYRVHSISTWPKLFHNGEDAGTRAVAASIYARG